MNTIRIYLSLILLISPAIFSKGQSVNTLISARTLGLANSSATLTDEWSLLNNVSGISKIRNTATSVAYEARPGLVGANRMAAIVVVPAKIGVSGLGFFRFGDVLYSEQVISLGFGNEFGNTALGIKANYVQYRISGFGTKTALSLNLGGITKLTSSLTIGAYIVNLNQPKLSTIDGEKLPTHLVVGVAFKPTTLVSLFAEVDKDLDYNPIIKSALEYQVHKKVFARTGFNLNPHAAFFGIGFLTSYLKIDYAIQYTQNLNTAFQASIIYQVRKNQATK